MTTDADQSTPCTSSGTPTSHMTCVYTAPAHILAPLKRKDPEFKIFVGDGHIALMPWEFEVPKNNIWAVLNVAYSIDDQLQRDADKYLVDSQRDPHSSSPPPKPEPDQTLKHYNYQYAKVGLIDGPGNIPQQMGLIAALYAAEQMVMFPLVDNGDKHADQQAYKEYTQGNLLIHCHAGRSRSVTVAALYIWYKFGVQLHDPALTSFEGVYAMVKRLRCDSTNPPPSGTPGLPAGQTHYTQSPPSYPLQEAAFAIVDRYATLFPEMTFRK